MLGGYTVVVATNAGVNLWVAMLILAPLVVGIIGVIVERLLIRWLYGRMIDTLLATWGLSLLLIGLVTSIFGASTPTVISPPFGQITIGAYSSSAYQLFVIFVTLLLGLAIWAVLRFTKLGLVARGTMQNAQMASALGATYIAKAFITVISGGASILAGTAAGSVLLGFIQGVFTFLSGPTFGEVALLLAAIVLLRLMPRGITGRFFRKSL
jgi:branched-chain amino acid transport system permease protein